MGWKWGRCGDRGPERNAIRCPGCGLDQWEQVEFIVKSVTDTDPRFA